MKHFRIKLFDYIGNVGVVLLSASIIGEFFMQVHSDSTIKAFIVGIILIMFSSIITKEDLWK